MKILVIVLILFGFFEMVLWLIRFCVGLYEGLTKGETSNPLDGKPVKVSKWIMGYQFLTVIGIILILIHLFTPIV